MIVLEILSRDEILGSTRIGYINQTSTQRMLRNTLLAFRPLGSITSCPRLVLVFHEKIG